MQQSKAIKSETYTWIQINKNQWTEKGKKLKLKKNTIKHIQQQS